MHNDIKLDPIGVSRLNLIDNETYTLANMSYFSPSFWREDKSKTSKQKTL